MVAVVRSNYPQTQLTRERCEQLKEATVSNVEVLDDNGDDHPILYLGWTKQDHGLAKSS